MTTTYRQLSYINSLLDQAKDQHGSEAVLEVYNKATGADEGNVGSAKGSGTGLRKRLPRLDIHQASKLITALQEL